MSYRYGGCLVVDGGRRGVKVAGLVCDLIIVLLNKNFRPKKFQENFPGKLFNAIKWLGT